MRATQCTFFDSDPKPKAKAKASRIVRRSHPATSYEAACKLVASGTLAGDASDALELVRQNPGRTAYELEAIDKMPSGKGFGRPDRIRKRLAGLADSVPPQIWRGKSRQCQERLSKCITWWPFDPQSRGKS